MISTRSLSRKMVPVLIGLVAWCHATPVMAAVSPQDMELINKAVPAKALATPVKPRRLLIFDSNVGYGGHPSAAHAAEAFRLMGERTGAFTVTASRDPQVFSPEQLKRFDAVFFNNTVGNLFEDPALRRSLVEFVYRGGGLMGVHGTSVAFTRWPGAIEDWPEFGRMLGARGANHRESTERVILKVEDPRHPVTQMFNPAGFEYRDEFFRFSDPYSRQRVRVLMSIDTNRTDLNQGAARGTCLRPDNDYALAWVRNYGRGRVFYCTIAHNPYVFWDARMLEFYLAAAQFALGDLQASTLPSAWLTPAAHAREQLGWRPALLGTPDAAGTVAQAIDKAAASRLPYLTFRTGQPLSAESHSFLDPKLSANDMEELRLRLDNAGLRLLGYDAGRLPAEPSPCLAVLDFARTIGAELVLAEGLPGTAGKLELACTSAEMDVALRPSGATPPAEAWQPDRLLALCEGGGKRVGVHVDLSQWFKAGVRIEAGVARLGHRIKTVSVPMQLSPRDSQTFDKFLASLAPERIKPHFIGFQALPSLTGDAAGVTNALSIFDAAAQRQRP